MQKGVTNLNSFVLEEQRKNPKATGDLTMIFNQIAFAAKVISREVNKAGIANIVGKAHSVNVHGEEQQKLDVFANKKMIQALAHTGTICAMASEEAEGIIHVPDEYPKGRYAVVFDPLDGSSNIDVNVAIGTIFGVYRAVSHNESGSEEDFLQRGNSLVCAGYIVYGSSTMLVYTTGNGVSGFTLDPSVGEFILSHPDMRAPDHGSIYAVNEANFDGWEPAIKRYVSYLKNFKERRYTGRYIGSFVADFHRNLLKGGVFLYPAYPQFPRGRLRLVYEANPMAFIIERAGGMAIDGHGNILDKKPEKLHQYTPLVIGSRFEVELFLEFMRAEGQ